VPAQFGIDIFSEAERLLEQRLDFVVLSSVLEEVNNKVSAQSNRTEARIFRVAQELSARCTVIDIEQSLQNHPVDTQLLIYTESVKGILATNDRELRARARSRGVPVLLLRGKKRLSLEGTVI
jgi:rRNA-processing protein FCF1